MVLKIQTDERAVTVSKNEELTVPATPLYEFRLEEVPDADHGIEIRRISPTTKNGSGSGSILSGGTYSGLTNRNYKIQIDGAGDIGTATFKWSNNGGSTWQGEAIPIEDTDPIELELGITVQPMAGVGQDFDLGDFFTFTAEFWSEVEYIPTQSKEYQVNYVNGDVTFHSDDAGKEVQVSYEGRGSLVDAGDINQIIEVLNKGEVALRNVDTSEFEVNEAIAVLDSNTYQKASAEEDTRPAVGFVKVSDSEEGEIQLFGPMDGFTGLIAGARYYLDTVEGGITPTSPSGQGNIKQVVGRALSATRLLVSISQDYIINP